jgi:hypothetical protein
MYPNILIVVRQMTHLDVQEADEVTELGRRRLALAGKRIHGQHRVYNSAGWFTGAWMFIQA